MYKLTDFDCRVHIMSMGILYICHLRIVLWLSYILSAENIIFIDFFAVKVDGSEVKVEIFKEVFM